MTIVDPTTIETAALSPEVIDTATRAMATDAAAISNLIDAERGADSRLALAVPFNNPPHRTSALVFIAQPERLVPLLHGTNLELSEILVAVTDGQGHLIARSREADRFIGKPVPDWTKLQALGTDTGRFEALTKEGGKVMFSFRKLATTPGWMLVVGEPLTAFNARWQQPLLALVLGSGAALLVALLGAGWTARRILGPLQALAKHGRDIASSEHKPVQSVLPPSRVREFEALRRSFITAEQALRDRADRERRTAESLALSERRYRAVAEAGALVFWRRAPSGHVISATGWRELTGRPETEAVGLGWMSSIHPDDLAEMEAIWRDTVVAGKELDIEFRVLTHAGRWNWVRARGVPIRDDNAEIVEWVGSLEDVDARRMAQARVAHMAHHDALTGLGNRTLMSIRMTEAVEQARTGQRSALLCIDLDRFKAVNDTLGHPAGDAVLCTVSERLRRCVRDDDVLIRLGGDEFAVLQRLPNLLEKDAELGSHLVRTLGAPYYVKRRKVTIGASVGIAIIDGSVADAAEILRRADLALYAAKNGGRGQHRIFEPHMDSRTKFNASHAAAPAQKRKATAA